MTNYMGNTCEKCGETYIGTHISCKSYGKMDAVQRDKFARAFIEKALQDMLLKGQEYEVDGHASGNFGRVASMAGITPLQAWMTHFTKHIDSIANFIKRGHVIVTGEPIEGRIGDAINYLLILATLIEEARQATGKLPYNAKPASSDTLDVKLSKGLTGASFGPDKDVR